MSWLPYCNLNKGVRYNVVLTKYSATTWFQDPLFRRFGHFLAISQRDYTEGESVELRVKTSEFFLFDSEEGALVLDCTIEAVLEPLKCRTISKGEADFYFACKCLQEAIHGRMRRMRVFRLIGQTISADMLLDLEQTGCDYYISGDYKSSTDYSSSRVGQMIGHEIWGAHTDFDPRTCTWVTDRVLPRWLEQSADAVFGLHRISYPPRMEIESTLQRNGQLMGSILSFVILCLINLAVYRQTAQTEGLNEHAVLINGDDIVFRGTLLSYATYKRCAARVGLILSVGKTYVHRRYANMNSVCFDRTTGGSGQPHVTVVEYLNVSLVLGKHKVQAKLDFRDSMKNIQERGVAHWNVVARSARLKNLQFLWRVFEKYNADELRRSTSFVPGMKRPLFHPTIVGGLGLTSPFKRATQLTAEEFACVSHHVASYETAGVGLSELPARGVVVAVRAGLVEREPDVHDKSSIAKPRIEERRECLRYYFRNWACVVNSDYVGCPPDQGYGASKGVALVEVSKTVSIGQALNNSVPSTLNPPSEALLRLNYDIFTTHYGHWDPADLGHSYGAIFHEEIDMVGFGAHAEDSEKALQTLLPDSRMTVARRLRAEHFVSEGAYTAQLWGCRHVWVDLDLTLAADKLRLAELFAGKIWLQMNYYGSGRLAGDSVQVMASLHYPRYCNKRVYGM
jgi:hypothetical protein